MENGEDKKYLPVKLKKGGEASGSSLVDTGELKLLAEYVDNLLNRAAEEILDGSIECSPYYKNDNDNACLYCEYHPVCTFDEASGDRRSFARKIKPSDVWEELKNPKFGTQNAE